MSEKRNKGTNPEGGDDKSMKSGEESAQLIASVPIPKIIEAGQLVLNYGLSGARNELLLYLVKSVLLDASDKTPMSAYDIATGISNKFAVIAKYSVEHVELMIQELKDSECVKVDTTKTPEAYWLSEETEVDVRQLYENAMNIQGNVVGRLLKDITDDYGNTELAVQEDITRCIYSVFGNIFAMHGYEAAALLVDYPVGAGHLYDIPDFSIAMDKATADITDRKLRIAIRNRYERMFYSPDSSEQQFMAMMALGYIVVAVLNLDPELRSVSEAVLGRSIFLVDTNILLSLLLPNSRFHEVNRRLVKIGQASNVELALAKRTKEELVHMLKKSSMARLKVPKDLSPELLLMMSEIVDDEIESTYFSKLAEAPAMKWEDFVKVVEHIDEALDKSVGIKLIEAHHDQVEQERDRLFDVTIEAMDLWETRYPFKRPKSEWVAEHDAFVYLLARKMQRDFGSGRYERYAYILTADMSVLALTPRLKDETLGAVHVLPSTFLNMNLPFLMPKTQAGDTAETLARLIATPYIVSSTKTVPASKLVKLVRPWMGEAGLSRETIIYLVRDRYVQEALERQEQAVIGTEEIETERIDRALIAALGERLETAVRGEAEARANELGTIHDILRSVEDTLVMELQRRRRLHNILSVALAAFGICIVALAVLLVLRWG